MVAREKVPLHGAPPNPIRAIGIYVGSMILFSAPWLALLVHADRLDIGRGFPIYTLMWAPALAAFLTCTLTRTSFSFLGEQPAIHGDGALDCTDGQSLARSAGAVR